jgi:cobalt-zinc-cadmium efflux system membrane fusion protein
VFVALGGLLYWGHRTGWAVPKFSALTGATPTKDDWCPEHAVSESNCVECNPALLPRPKAHGWCDDHGISECPLCHPDVAQLPKPPAVTDADRERAARALAFTDRPENDPKCVLNRRRIQFASAEAADKAGVGVEPVWTAPVVEAVTGPGEVAHDPTRTARLSTRSPGTVFRAYKQVGERVAAGEVVALIDAAEVGKAKAEFLQALVSVRLLTATVARLRQLETSGSGSPQRRQEVEASLNESRIRVTTAQQALTNLGLPVRAEDFEKVPDDQLAGRLRFLGLPRDLADAFDPQTTTGNLLPVVAPLDGVVTTRDVVAGEVVAATKVLFVVVDPSRVWVTLDLRLEDAARVEVGQKVAFRPDGSKAEAVGAVEWVSPETDHRTRTVKVRAAVPNDDGRLRANTFGLGRVVLREEKEAVVVPNGAVHWEGCCHVVFVRDKGYLKADAPKVFHVRTVRPAAKGGANTEVVGLLPGELVAVKGSSALRAELLRGKMGEG